MRRCPGCGRELPLEDFVPKGIVVNTAGWRRNQIGDNRGTWCKRCRRRRKDKR